MQRAANVCQGVGFTSEAAASFTEPVARNSRLTGIDFDFNRAVGQYRAAYQPTIPPLKPQTLDFIRWEGVNAIRINLPQCLVAYCAKTFQSNGDSIAYQATLPKWLQFTIRAWLGKGR